ncbi:MAG: hypothetical protein JWQ87_2270 [Candidatus Sulfotelmatobacter sp.]|nr:hypothetical protein [Candidatus Sulfotelmatobacter sp.]
MPRAAKAVPAGKVAKHLSNLALGKKYYKKSDAALDEVLEKLPRCETCKQPVANGLEVKLRSGKKVRLVDKFADKHRTNVGQNARRYEFEEVTLP